MLDVKENWEEIFIAEMKKLFPWCKVKGNSDLGGHDICNKGFFGGTLVCILTAGVDYGKSYAPKTVDVAVYSQKGYDMMVEFEKQNPDWTVYVKRSSY